MLLSLRAGQRPHAPDEVGEYEQKIDLPGGLGWWVYGQRMLPLSLRAGQRPHDLDEVDEYEQKIDLPGGLVWC